MTTIALAAAVVPLALLGLALAVAVLRLRMDVRRLAAQVGARGADEPEHRLEAGQPVAGGAAVPGGTALGIGASRATSAERSQVPVITSVEFRPGRPEVPAGRIVSVSLGESAVKLLALAHGLRCALSDDARLRAGVAFRRELRRQRRLRSHHHLRARRPHRRGWLGGQPAGVGDRSVQGWSR